MSTSTHSQASSSRSSSQQANCLDPLDALIDFSAYDTGSYDSPSTSPAASAKPHFVRPVASTPTTNNALLPSSQQVLSGPSHNYDRYKQQTGIPPASIANTLAMNSNNLYSYNYMTGMGTDDFLDFGSAPKSSFEMDVEFDSPSTEPAFFYPEQALSSSSEYVNPNVIARPESQSAALPTQTSNVGRLWPGMHQQQAALAKAQQQQKQQQELIQQQQQRQSAAAAQHTKSRAKSHPSTDPIVEEKISQLLNSMRHGSVATSETDDGTTSAMTNAQRIRKDEEDMDEDERLLASEEGKKLSSKERRQLRNKVSARAFRSRRKEYIGQLEGELATKVNEANDLRAHNRALVEENTRLSDLTRMLLQSPAFSGFLDTLTPNVAAPQAPAPAPTPAPVERPQAESRVRKDVNPYAVQQQMHNQEINLAILPDQPIDFSMLDLNVDGGYSYQPQVFSVLDIPEVTIDTSILSGKTSNSVGACFDSDDEKVELPIMERMPVKEIQPIETIPVVDEEFDADPAFALFSQSTTSSTPLDLELTPIFGGIEPEKALCRMELVDAADCEVIEAISMARVERLCLTLDDISARLESMIIHL